MLVVRAIMAGTVIVIGIALLCGFVKIFDIVAACVLASTCLLYRATHRSPAL